MTTRTHVRTTNNRQPAQRRHPRHRAYIAVHAHPRAVLPGTPNGTAHVTARRVTKSQQATAPASAATQHAASTVMKPPPPPGSTCELRRTISRAAASSRRSPCPRRCLATAVRDRRRTLVRGHRRRAQLSLRPPPCAQHRSLAAAARSPPPLGRRGPLASISCAHSASSSASFERFGCGCSSVAAHAAIAVFLPQAFSCVRAGGPEAGEASKPSRLGARVMTVARAPRLGNVGCVHAGWRWD